MRDIQHNVKLMSLKDWFVARVEVSKILYSFPRLT